MMGCGMQVETSLKITLNPSVKRGNFLFEPNLGGDAVGCLGQIVELR